MPAFTRLSEAQADKIRKEFHAARRGTKEQFIYQTIEALMQEHDITANAEVVAHLAHDSLAVAEHGTGERTATVLGDEHQMGVALPDSVSTASNRVLVIRDTNGTI